MMRTAFFFSFSFSQVKQAPRIIGDRWLLTGGEATFRRCLETLTLLISHCGTAANKADI